MTSQKKRNRARKRVFGMIDDAWRAIGKGELALAEKLSHRAVTEGAMNPRVWVEHGRLLRTLGKDRKGETALRHAIAMAPTYGAAFAALADLLFARDNVESAVRLQRRAVELGREHRDEYAAALVRYEAAAEQVVPEPAGVEEDDGEPVDDPVSALQVDFDWTEIATKLLEKGIARLPGVLDSDQLSAWIGLLERAAEVARVAEESARGEESEEEAAADDVEDHVAWAPVPDGACEPVDRLRAELYRAFLPIACDWAARTGREAAFPPRLSTLLRSCTAIEQGRSGIEFARLPAAAIDPPKALPRQQLTFPLGGFLCLAGRLDVELEDLRPGRKRRVTKVLVRAGDGVVFAATERLVSIAGVYGLQPVGTGLAVGDEPAAGVFLLMHDQA